MNYVPTKDYGHSGVAAWEPLLERAHALVPALRERAAKANAERKIARETVDDFYDLKLLRHYQPEAFGGENLPWGVMFHLGRILAHGCPSSAWVSTVVASQMVVACRLRPEAQEEIFADTQDVLMGMGSIPTDVTADEVEGGARVSGRWRFVSGVDYADWIVLMMAPFRQSDSETVLTIVPKRDVEIDDNWFVTGLKGTGSKDIQLNDVFIPSHRLEPRSTIWGDGPPGTRTGESFIWQKSLGGYYGAGIIGPVMGMAEAGLEAYREITAKRFGTATKQAVSDSSQVQIRLAQSDADVKAARMILENQIHFLRQSGETGRPITVADRLTINRDRAYATNLCVAALERLSRHMGAIGIFESNPVQLFHNDARAGASQIAVNFDQNMARFGQHLLGIDAQPIL